MNYGSEPGLAQNAPTVASVKADVLAIDAVDEVPKMQYLISVKPGGNHDILE